MTSWSAWLSNHRSSKIEHRPDARLRQTDLRDPSLRAGLVGCSLRRREVTYTVLRAAL